MLAVDETDAIPRGSSAPERGTSRDGVGTFTGDDVHDGKAGQGAIAVVTNHAHPRLIGNRPGQPTVARPGINWISELTRKT